MTRLFFWAFIPKILPGFEEIHGFKSNTLSSSK